jgi:hypothetical protein
MVTLFKGVGTMRDLFTDAAVGEKQKADGDKLREALTPTTQTPEISTETITRERKRRIDYKIIRSDLIPFTLELATRFIEMATFVGERHLKSKHVDYLVSEAKDGKFLCAEAGLASCYCCWDKIERRLNGQHTSWMRTYMPANWQPTIRVTKYSAPTEDDYRSLYATFDSHKSRTSGEKTIVVLLGADGFEDIRQTRVLQDLKAGMGLWIGGQGGGKNRLSFDNILDLMKDKHYKTVIEVGRYVQALNYCSAPHMVQRAPVVAAMYATFSKNISESIEFWTMVKDGGCPTHPAVVLNKYLHRTTLHKMGVIKSSSNRATSEEMFRICIVAWNAFRNKNDIKQLRMPEHRPVVL